MPRDESAGSGNPGLEQELERVFPGVPLQDLLRCLPSADELPSNGEYDRVLFSVIRLSRGDRSRLVHFADAARRDWRDVVYWAEQPRDEQEPTSWEELQERLGLKRGDPSQA